jgi:hypothetical protein
MQTNPDFEQIKQLANQIILESVHRDGLRPLATIHPSVMVNSTTPVSSTASHICVNYVNLESTTLTQQEQALRTVVEEEYKGILGISLERQWPYTSQKLLTQETYERLHANLVFILSPPNKCPTIARVPKAGGMTPPLALRFYVPDNDGFSQFRKNSLIKDISLGHSYAVTEVKTTHHFEDKDILAILAPEQYFELAASVFGEEKLIKVPSKKICLAAFSKYLESAHQQTLASPLTLDAPDYLSCIKALVASRRLETFSVHCLRLHTTFDFVTRKVCGLSGLEALLRESKAQVLERNDKDEALVMLHKQYAYDRDPIINRFKDKGMPTAMLAGIIASGRHEQAIFEHYRKHKGDYRLTLFAEKLPLVKQTALKKAKIDVMGHPHYTMLAFQPALELKLQAILDTPLETLAATNIQASYQGYKVRNLFSQFKVAKTEFEAAQHKMETLGAKLFA